MLRYAIPLLTVPLTGCGSASAPSPQAPAKAEPVAHESELLKLTLTPEAEQRLGIAVARVADGTASATRAVNGEVVVPAPGGGALPTGSAMNLQQLGLQQVAADGEVARAAAQARLARIALGRAQALVQEDAGSVRTRDEAQAALDTASASLQAARSQRQLLGPSVGSLNRLGQVWVRVTMFAGDLGRIRREASAQVSQLGGGGPARAARPVSAPPSANATAGTVDLFYALANGDGALKVGQRVAVDVPMSGQSSGLTVPGAAVLRDIHGGEWVYERTAPHTYVRQRIEVASETGGTALLARGLRSGADVVTSGAPELFGTEFGAAH